jgi:hypothetical protein
MNPKGRIFRFALAGAFTVALFSMSAPAWADKDYKSACQDRLNADRYRINEDSKRRGENSPQVQRDVEKMDKDREWCRSHQVEWDHGLYDEGIYRKK